MIRNIEACKQLSKITRTSLGPNGMNKMVINHLERLFVTSDAAVIVRELEVAHPAARLLVMAAQSQEREMGDGTNLVVSFGGELLGLAEELVREGLHPSEIVEGYEKAAAKALEWMGRSREEKRKEKKENERGRWCVGVDGDGRSQATRATVEDADEVSLTSRDRPFSTCSGSSSLRGRCSIPCVNF